MKNKSKNEGYTQSRRQKAGWKTDGSEKQIQQKRCRQQEKQHWGGRRRTRTKERREGSYGMKKNGEPPMSGLIPKRKPGGGTRHK